MNAPRLEVRNLSKTFAGVTVLDNAHISIAPGEIHALVGQNGSGKSTLIKLISGVYRPDPGADILVDGERIGPPIEPKRLHEAGLAFVHQDLGLIADLSVRENARVGRHSTRRFTRWIDTAKDRAAVRQSFDFLGLDIDPAAKVATLTPSERVAVAVARALQERTPGTGVIVFDESSRAIPHEALPAFYEMIRFLARQGTAVLLVSHNLKEVLEIADRATALRNGRVVETGLPTADLDEAALTRLVLGHEGELDNFVQAMPTRLRDGGVELRDITGGRVRGVSAHVAHGEVLGVTGAVDSGLPGFAALLGGATSASGELVIDGTVLPLDRNRTIDLLRAGVAFIPQDRAAKGLATTLTVEENVTLPHLRTNGKPWWTGRRWQGIETQAILDHFNVTPADRKAVVATMSGGNQQKVLMGKWLIGKPALLVLDDPTQAVDVGARTAVLRATRQAAADGAAVVLCSSEVEDLAAVCDRVLVLEDGVVARELRGPFTADTILNTIFPPVEGDAA
ncbi:sugar ABC transporter ATP-binding protein [Diaminobutyricimonas sp. LJ205]|uniref:sugar ABC transporter ATP-binding protein n=1 Tax=Diaminobutyricimonas sp. LJ205 TaxID=2683590 RepID=UPI0012F48434|nr:sugar ABC transporter ATP-binding protein [Diaminobutyricimonas sp. LJ205]